MCDFALDVRGEALAREERLGLPRVDMDGSSQLQPTHTGLEEPLGHSDTSSVILYLRKGRTPNREGRRE